MAGVKGMKHVRPRAPKHSDAIEASKIENLLRDHYSNGVELSTTQLKAIEIRYARLKPTLAAVEQTQIDARDKLNPDELMSALAAKLLEKPNLLIDIIKSKPELLEEFKRGLVDSVAPAQQTAASVSHPEVTRH